VKSFRFGVEKIKKRKKIVNGSIGSIWFVDSHRKCLSAKCGYRPLKFLKVDNGTWRGREWLALMDNLILGFPNGPKYQRRV